MGFNDLLKMLIEKEGSDLFLTTGAPPSMKAFGRLTPLFLDLSLNLQGFVSQRLIPTVDGKRAAAIEVLLGTPRVCDLIKQEKVLEIKEVMEKGEQQGMKTFDSALFDLFKSGKISYEEALKNADSKNNLRLRIQLSQGKGADETDIEDEDSGGLSLVQADDDQNNIF